MLWLCLHFPDFPLELQEPADEGCLAVVDKHGSRRWIIACNEDSKEAGLHRGLDATTALSLVPQLKLMDRSRSREVTAMKALAAWAEQFSSFITFDVERWLLWIEIGGSLKYFGGARELSERITSSAEALGYSARTGVAPTIEAAALFARHARNLPIANRQELRDALELAPLNLLAIPQTSLEALHEIGWRRVGEILALPPDQLARRFGPTVPNYLQRLIGDQPDPREPYRAPAIYRRRFEFSAPVESVESMLFPLRRLLGELQGYLRGRDTALQKLELHFKHAKHPATRLEIRTTAPQRDAVRLFTLLRETLDRTPLPSGVEELSLLVEQFVPIGDTQLDLFDAAPKRDRSWNDLLDKLKARLGNVAVKRLGLADDHLPEKAWCVVRNDEAPGTDVPGAYPERPLWLIEPRPLQHLPRLLGKPERIESGWWAGNDAKRDYYIAQTPEGARWWLYRDAGSSSWFLHGIWA